MLPISIELIKKSFDNQNLIVFTNKEDLTDYFQNMDKTNSVFLMMSSGNYGGMNLEEVFKN